MRLSVGESSSRYFPRERKLHPEQQLVLEREGACGQSPGAGRRRGTDRLGGLPGWVAGAGCWSPAWGETILGRRRREDSVAGAGTWSPVQRCWSLACERPSRRRGGGSHRSWALVSYGERRNGGLRTGFAVPSGLVDLDCE
jgi:hypothetical protein